MKTAHIQAVATEEKHPRLVKWWNDGEGDKSAVVRAALVRYFDERANLEKISAQLDRIERLLIELVGERMGE